MIRIRNIQTRDCYYPVYRQEETTEHWASGFYFYDDELDSDGDMWRGPGYFGPYQTLDDVCKAQHRHYVSIMSL